MAGLLVSGGFFLQIQARITAHNLAIVGLLLIRVKRGLLEPAARLACRTGQLPLHAQQKTPEFSVVGPTVA